jgi:hypothetical protein
MRKLSMLVALGTIFSLALAVPALALVTTELGGGNNTYNEKACPPNGDETVFGRGGNDVLRLQVCGDNDVPLNEPEAAFPGSPPDSDIDIANGNSGKDRVRVDDGDVQDTATGGSGSNDRCVGDRDLGSDNAVGDPTPATGGTDEDIMDHLDPSCETIIWVNGDFYKQT